MLNINDIYVLVQNLVNKYKQGYVSPDEFNGFFNLAQNQYFNDLIGLPDQYQQGYPLPAVGKLYNQTMQDKLSPFFTPITVTLPGNSQVIKPTDMGSPINIILPGGVNCGIRPENKFVGFLTDSIDAPSITAPFAIDNGAYYQVYPVTGWPVGTSYVLNYYKTPPDSKWAYTLDANGLPVYDPSNSTQPIWRNNEYSDLISKTCTLIGANLANNQIVQNAQLQQKEG